MLVVVGLGLSFNAKNIVSAADADITNGIVVDSTLDTGDANVGNGICDDGAGSCTLRAAIEEANSNADATTISFNIAPLDGSVKTFTPASGYNTLTEQVTIDGSTQNGADCSTHTLKIEIDGNSVGGTNNVLGIGADSSIVKGLAFYGYTAGNYMVGFIEGDGGEATCNNFGIKADGSDGYPVTDTHGALAIEGASNTMVGGTSASDRNVFSSNEIQVPIGINENLIGAPSNTIIQGNYFGTDVAGLVAMPNAIGNVSINAGTNTTIGGLGEGEGNLIASNSPGLGNVMVSSSTTSDVDNSAILGNTFGLDANGEAASGFGTTGAITVGRGPGSTNITNVLIQGNTIRATGLGIWNLDLAGAFNTGVSILDNTISGATFGIDSCQDSDFDFICDINDGATLNDFGDTDTGPNNYINTPEISNIKQVGDQITFTYNLDAIDSPSDTYRVDFFYNDAADSEGMGQSQYAIGNTTADLSGGAVTELTATFTLPSTTDITSKVFSSTTTAIDSSATYGYGSTSEFGGKVLGATTSYSPAVAAQNGQNNSSGGSLAETGQEVQAVAMLASSVLTVTAVLSLTILNKSKY